MTQETQEERFRKWKIQKAAAKCAYETMLNSPSRLQIGDLMAEAMLGVTGLRPREIREIAGVRKTVNQ